MPSGTGLLSVAVSPVGHRLAVPRGGRARDRVAHLCGPVAVLEVPAVRPDAAAVADGGQEVVQLVHERVLPADDVAGRPPVLQEGVIRLGHEHGAEALRPLAGPRALEVEGELVDALELEADRPLRPVDLPRHRVLAAGAEARGLQRADRAAL